MEDAGTGQSVDENLKMKWEKLSSVNLCRKYGMGRNEEQKNKVCEMGVRERCQIKYRTPVSFEISDKPVIFVV